MTAIGSEAAGADFWRGGAYLASPARSRPRTPPAGFTGTADHWHEHPTLCFNPTLGLIVGDAMEFTDVPP